jgi:energy-converting hydrogenase Eha subunit G
MWILLYLLLRDRRYRRRPSSEPGASIVLFLITVGGVIIAGFWGGLAFAAAGIVVYIFEAARKGTS